MPYVRRTTPAESDEEFIVEAILDCRGRGGSTEYLVKWEGYEEPSWTWYFNCDCPEKLAEFRRQRRLDRRYQQARNEGRPVRRQRRRAVRVQDRRPSSSASSSGPSSSSDSGDSVPPPEVVQSDVPCIRAAEGEPTCVVCLEHRITHIVQPCNHACLCGRCSEMVATLHGCPKCRRVMTRIAPFYIG